MDDHKIEVEADKKKKIIKIVEDGQKSEHWILLHSEVEKLIKRNETYLVAFNRKTFKSEKDVQEHTQIVIATNFMRWFLNINDKIIQDNLSFFKKLEKFTSEAFQKAESFVKK